MPYTSVASGITFSVPTAGTTNYDTTLLTSFTAISAHDHTGTGKGLQLGTNALQDDAVDDTKFRARNNQWVLARNGTNDDDSNVWRLNTSNQIEFGSTILTTAFTLSGLTASMPVFTNSSGYLVSGPTLVSSFTPLWAGTGSMSYAATTTFFRYYLLGKICVVTMRVTGTTAGVASNVVTGTLPLASAANGADQGFGGRGYAAGVPFSVNVGIASGSSSMSISKYDSTNFALGVTDYSFNFSYEIA